MARTYKFHACRISRKDNILFPDELIVDKTNECITYRKFRIIGYDTKKVSFRTIASVSIRRHILFADIVIETFGGSEIIVEGFSFSDAEKIAKHFS